MGRNRVLSFMSALSSPSSRNNNSNDNHEKRASSASFFSPRPPSSSRPQLPPSAAQPPYDTPSPQTGNGKSVTPLSRSDANVSRPTSTVVSHKPPSIDVFQDTLPELQPIFSFLNSQANKLYHEGYFLKLDDLDTHGRLCPNRRWVECYAQLVGTVLSLWDAVELDAAGQNADASPTFINLADASIKMIDSLPTRQDGRDPVTNVLSISSAGSNRYLLHFSSFHSLTQWTAALRLALFEYTSLYEAYTGSIIAGKGRLLSNIRAITDRTRHKYEDWARVRFAPGTPWRRCWVVIHPPDEKEARKSQGPMLRKKRFSNDRSSPSLKGYIHFYDTNKTKKARPIAAITDAYAAYAIYPQSTALIDQSSLLKIEGRISNHMGPEPSNEKLVFIMPEVRPAASGFEAMLRFLFPTFDAFGLYGRPSRLIAETNHIKSLMFAFPKRRCYGYLDILDVTSLVHTPGSQNWSEEEWRKQLKEATARRMAAAAGSRRSSVSAQSRPRYRTWAPSRHAHVGTGFGSGSGPVSASDSTPPSRHTTQSADTVGHDEPTRQRPFFPPGRVFSDTHTPSAVSSATRIGPQVFNTNLESSPTSPANDDDEILFVDRRREPQVEDSRRNQFRRPVSPLSPVESPPAFAHGPGEMPQTRPRASPEMTKASNRMSHGTLSLLTSAGNVNNNNNNNNHALPSTQNNYYQSSPRGAELGGLRQQEQQQQPGFTGYRLAVGKENEQSSLARGETEFNPNYYNNNHTTTNDAGGSLSSSSHHSRGIPLRIDTSRSLKRKPVPQLQQEQQQQQRQQQGEPPRLTAEPSLEELYHVIDEEMLDHVGLGRVSPSSPDDNNKDALFDDDKSIYEDADVDDQSTASPDYASTTHESTHSRLSEKSIPKPRMGVLKTVGMEPSKDLMIGDARYSIADKPPEQSPHIPTIDFGPTLSMEPTAGGPPATSDSMLKGLSQPRNNNNNNNNNNNPNKHHSVAADRTRRASLGNPLGAHSHSRSSSGGNEIRRSMQWQPGLASSTAAAGSRPASPGNALSQEQILQQRAVANSPIPMYHHRSPSMTPSPPLHTPSLGDSRRHSRSSSYFNLNRDNNNNSPTHSSSYLPLTRPPSRGANSMLNFNNDFISRLSAREQEHVARMTGSSLLNMSNENTKEPAPIERNGLIAAIDARERERRSMKEGLSNQMVQHAIAQRHQQLLQQQQMQLFSQTQANPGQLYGSQQQGRHMSMYNMPGANRTWDGLNRFSGADEPRRQSWYGQFSPPAQQPQATPSSIYGQSQSPNNRNSGYYQ